MSFRTGLLARVDRIRQIPQKAYDIRQNTVDIVKRVWSGTTVGDGSHVDLKTRLYVGGSFNIRVQQVTAKDVVASGGELTEKMVKVGPFTPQYPTGGLDNPVFDPHWDGRHREILFLLKGHGMGPRGRYFKRVYDSSLMNFTTMLYLEQTGEQI